MRAEVVKRLRRIVYGKGHHPGPVKHFINPKIPGVCIANKKRRDYQQVKRAYRQGEFVL
jgi:hypothetical protein